MHLGSRFDSWKLCIYWVHYFTYQIEVFSACLAHHIVAAVSSLWVCQIPDYTPANQVRSIFIATNQCAYSLLLTHLTLTNAVAWLFPPLLVCGIWLNKWTVCLLSAQLLSFSNLKTPEVSYSISAPHRTKKWKRSLRSHLLCSRARHRTLTYCPTPKEKHPGEIQSYARQLDCATELRNETK